MSGINGDYSVSFHGDPKKKSSNDTIIRNNGSINIYAEYKKYQEQQKADFEKYQQQQNTEYQEYMEKQNAEYEKYMRQQDVEFENYEKNVSDFGSKQKNIMSKAMFTSNEAVGLPIEKIPHLETDENGNKVNNYYDENKKLIKSEPYKASAKEIQIENTPKNEMAKRKVDLISTEQQTNNKKAEIQEYLKKDENYKEWQQYYDKAYSRIFEISQKYGLEATSIELAKSKISNSEDLQEYVSLLNTLYNERNSLSKYEEEVANWQDGPLPRNTAKLVRWHGETEGIGSNYAEFMKGDRVLVQHNGRLYSNVERITLKNGQHAWKSDQGVFYMWSNGKIGLDEVPKELIK